MSQNPADGSCAERALVSGSARRRRERLLRSFLRHERMTVRMELAVALHHSRDGGRESYYGLRAPKTASSEGRPGVLKEPEPPNVVDRVQRHTVEQRIEHTPLVQILDAPVPQKVEQLLEVLRRLDVEVPAQVSEVPKISQDSIRERLVDCDLRHPQMAEQLVEVPTVASYSSLLQRTVEQTVDIPASRGRGLRGGIEGFFPGQSSTAPSFSEQIVDIPVPRGDLQGFLPGQGSTASSSHSPDAANEAGVGVFRTFLREKKSAEVAGQVSADMPRHVSSWTPAAYEDMEAADEPFMPRRVFEVVKKGCVDMLRSPLASTAAKDAARKRLAKLLDQERRGGVG